MTLAIIGLPRTRMVLSAAIQQARGLGLDVILVNDSETDAWFERGIDQGAFVLVSASFDDLEGLAERLRGLGCSALVSLTEFRMVTAAKLRSYLGLPGTSEVVERAVIDKSATRTVLADKGLTGVRFEQANGEGLELAVRKVGVPAVVKPRGLTGSIGVWLVDNESQVRDVRHAHRAHPMIEEEDYLVESFVDGPEISVEGLCVDGTFFLYALTDKFTTGAPHFIETGHAMPSIHHAWASRVESYLGRVVAALGITTAPIHAEVKLATDCVELIEIHTRYGGDAITQLLEEAFGYQVFSDYFSALISGARPSIPQPARAIANVVFFASGPGRFEALDFPGWLTEDDSVVETAVYFSAPTDLACEITPVERLGHVIWRSPDNDHAQAWRERIGDETRIAVVPARGGK